MGNGSNIYTHHQSYSTGDYMSGGQSPYGQQHGFNPQQQQGQMQNPVYKANNFFNNNNTQQMNPLSGRQTNPIPQQQINRQPINPMNQPPINPMNNYNNMQNSYNQGYRPQQQQQSF